MRLTPRFPVRTDDPVVVSTELTTCTTCGGAELYSLSRTVDAEWVDLRLCRSCHADNPLVAEIDRLTESALAE